MRQSNLRPINGVLLLDKPNGWTSNAALQVAKRIYQAQKAGHTGSLDPLASGLLPICLGEATKLSGLLLNANKSYWFTCRLGVTTTTGDSEGTVVNKRPIGCWSREHIENVLRLFTGQINQIPPMYSALKRSGQPLYKLARCGIEVERLPRAVVIHEFRLLRYDDKELVCEIRCSKGTYIRTLVTDIGEALGCGAYVSLLRRVAVEPYDSSQMVTLDALREQAEMGQAALEQALLPMDTVVANWPSITVSGYSALCLRQGQPVFVPHAPTAGQVRLYHDDKRFMGIGEILDDGRVAPRRLLAS